MNVDVSAEDIASGVRNDCGRCPVAKSIERQGFDAFVGIETVAVRERTEGAASTIYRLPAWVEDWISQFDAGEPVQPIAFDLVAR